MKTHVWISGDHQLLGSGTLKTSFTVLGDKYAHALRVCANAQPVMFPLAEPAQIEQLLSEVDGVMLTGSPSNVHPSNYGEALLDAHLPLDLQRDALTLALVQACVAQAIPLLGVCRGFQEMNVALGGSLHQRVHARGLYQDHRERASETYEQQYAPRHAIEIDFESEMAQWAGGTSAHVNSLHGQGIARLADPLQAIAHAPDGLIEAVVVRNARTFAYGVQWHPEWQCQDNPFYSAIFQAFGKACAARRQERLGSPNT